MGEVGYSQLARAYLKAGRAADAERAARAALNLRPAAVGVQRLLGLALLRQGRVEEALEAIEKEPLEVTRLSGLAIVHHAAGRSRESDLYLAELTETSGESVAFQVANVYAWRGEPDLAFEWLDKALALKDPYVSAAPSYFGFESLRSDPRWQPFLARIGQSEADLEAIGFNVPPPPGAP